MSGQPSEPLECTVCSNTNIREISHHFKHTTSDGQEHIMCLDCIKEFARVCTCDKEFRQEPTTLCILCSCSDDQHANWIYSDIKTNFLLDLLRKWSGSYLIIDGCRGCKYTIPEIQKDVKIGLKAAVEACVYEEIKNINNVENVQEQLNAVRYVSDALDDDFIKEISKFVDVEKLLGQPTDI